MNPRSVSTHADVIAIRHRTGLEALGACHPSTPSVASSGIAGLQAVVEAAARLLTVMDGENAGAGGVVLALTGLKLATNDITPSPIQGIRPHGDDGPVDARIFSRDFPEYMFNFPIQGVDGSPVSASDQSPQ